MENMAQYISIALLVVFILFWACLYVYDRVKEANFHRQISKSSFGDRQYDRPKKPWGIYILITFFIILFLFIILFRLEDSSAAIYEQGYEDGFQAGIESVQRNPGAYLG